MVGPENAYKHRTPLYLAASASAEIIADIALCPWEAVKVKLQTAPESAPFAKGTVSGMTRIVREEGTMGFYKGLGPLWMRQVPYTMAKFAAFERTVEAIYKHCMSHPKEHYNKAQQLGVTFVAGYIAGVFCALVSHPADTVVSKLNNMRRTEGESTAKAIGVILSDLGLVGVWRGLGTRIFMIGTLTGLQWFIYDTFKVYVGLPTSGAAQPSPTSQA
jgi:solute carrier family 25 phosphate transporter 3